jgi:nitrogen fixation NifU-like protein
MAGHDVYQDSHLEDLYREIILDHYRSPRNRGELPTPPALRAEGFNPLCGDEIVVYLLVEDGVVTDVKIGGQGCSISQSSASMMSAAVKGKTVAETRGLLRTFKSMMSIHEASFGDDGAGDGAGAAGSAAASVGAAGSAAASVGAAGSAAGAAGSAAGAAGSAAGSAAGTAGAAGATTATGSDEDGAGAGDEPAEVRLVDPSSLGELAALQGVVKFPVRIKCATLSWNTLAQALDETEAGASA